MSTAKSDARLNFRLSRDNKEVIESAAVQTGQSVNDFAISTLVDAAHRILDKHQTTILSRRDRELFVSMLDDDAAAPNEALLNAVHSYRRQGY